MIGPGGHGSRLIAPTLVQPPRSSDYVQLRRVLYTVGGQDLIVRVSISAEGYTKAFMEVNIRVQTATRYARSVMLRVTLQPGAQRNRESDETESEDSVMILIFVMGLQLGVLIGAVFCIRYLRQELSAEIGPKLKQVQAQLDSLEAALNLAVLSRYTELSDRLVPDPVPPPRSPLR